MSTLAPGDIAFVGFGADAKSFSFVLLKPVDAGTQIVFTDNGWLAAGGFRAGEGVQTWTASAGLNAGSVITISDLNGTLNPSQSGDQFIAYQLDGSVVHPLAAVDFADGDAKYDAGATNSNTSAVPTGLVAGSTALAFGADNGSYIGTTTGTPASLLAAIANPANWTVSETAGQPYPASFTVISGTSISVTGGSVTEGDHGDTTLTFTVTRSDTSGAFTVDYATHDGGATAGSDYDAAQGTLTFAAGGPATQTVSITVHGDTDLEPNEAFTLSLANVQNTTGAAVIASATGTGTILNDDFRLIHTYEIQGAGHTSSFVGQDVVTEGVVTAIDTTGSRPTVQVGDKVQVEGVVSEYGGSDPNNLTITELNASHITAEGTGTITPTVIGEGGRQIPTEVIDSDHLTTFNPDHDAIDFYESIEGMLVTVKNAQAVDSTYLGSTWVVADDGAGATGMNDRGGITIAANDQNPEKIQVYTDSGVTSLNPTYVAGDHLGDVTGVVSYYGGQYELLPTAIGSTASAGAVVRETTTLSGDADHVTIGAYNVENLDPTDPQAKFDQLGQDIAHNLGSPDIVGLEEIQDADGAGAGTDYSGAATLTKLIDAIVAAGGPHYAYVEIAPTGNNQTGGEPNGNIRQAFLYNPDRVSFVDGSLHQIADDNPANGDAYNNSRKPLVGDFMFNGEKITAIDIHNYSRGGSEESFGQDQPPLNSGEQRRIDQTAPVEHYVQGVEQTDPQAHVVVMGDFNGFQFETAQTQLETGGILTNLTNELDPTDRYSYAFEGNMQQIDNLFVSPSLQTASQFDIVHLNTGMDDTRPTDHDPIVSRLLVNTAPIAVADLAAVNENQSVTIDVLANDNDINTNDAKTLVSVSDTALGGHVAIVDGELVYTADADSFDPLTAGQSVTDSFSYTMQDIAGVTSTATVTVTVNGVANAPTQSGGNGDSTLNGTAGEESLVGGNGSDKLFGNGGADSLEGGNGTDSLSGGTGADVLSGGNGKDVLDGGAGADRLTGGNGDDRFVFSGAFGRDTVTDFTHGDQIQLDHSAFADFGAVMSHAEQVGTDVVITLDATDSITLTGVKLASLNSGDFLFA